MFLMSTCVACAVRDVNWNGRLGDKLDYGFMPHLLGLEFFCWFLAQIGHFKTNLKTSKPNAAPKIKFYIPTLDFNRWYWHSHRLKRASLHPLKLEWTPLLFTSLGYNRQFWNQKSLCTERVWKGTGFVRSEGFLMTQFCVRSWDVSYGCKPVT